MAQFKLRIPDDLYHQAKTAAAAEDRSLNWWINQLIRSILANSETCDCTTNTDATIALGYPVRCPHCEPHTPIPIDEWRTHTTLHH